LRNWRGSGFVTQRSTSGSGWTEQQGLRRHAWGSEEYAYFTRELSSENYDASREAAALLSGGDLTVSAYLVLNEASTIQSSGDITITADEIDNRTLSTTTVRDSERRRFYNGSNNISISNLSDQYQTCLAGQTDCTNDSTLQNLRGETTYYTNADGSLYGEARILSNGNVTINTQSGIRSDGRIQGSNVSLDGGAGGIQNGADSGSVVRFERQSTRQVDISVSESVVGQEVRGCRAYFRQCAIRCRWLTLSEHANPRGHRGHLSSRFPVNRPLLGHDRSEQSLPGSVTRIAGNRWPQSGLSAGSTATDRC